MTRYACRGTFFPVCLRWYSVFRVQTSGMVQNLGLQTAHGYTEECFKNTARILHRRPRFLFVGRVDGQEGEYRSYDSVLVKF